MIWVTEAKYQGEYTIEIKFNNGHFGLVDFHSAIFSDSRNIFAQLRDKDQFKQFQVEMDTVVWTNGLDLAPEFLYDLMLNQSKANQLSKS